MAYGTRQAARVDELLKRLERFFPGGPFDDDPMLHDPNGSWVRYEDVCDLLHQACIEAERE